MIKSTLLPHQEQTVSLLLKKKCLGDWSVMGTGKSLSALAAIDKVGKKAVIACPPYLVNNWINEIKKHTTLTPSPHFLKLDPNADVYVVPYTKLEAATEVFKHCKFWVADECHFLKNLQAKRTMRYHSLFYAYTPEYFMTLTGTPMKNRIVELYSILLLWDKWGVTPRITDKYKSYYTFCCRFTNVVQGKYGLSFGGMKNVEELRSYLVGNSIRHSADLLNLPELTESNIIVSYKDDKELAEAFEQYTGAARMSAEITVKAKSSSAKAPYTANYVKDAIDSGEGPVVVFSDHRKPLEIMALELSDYRVRDITGDVSTNKRNEYIDMFNNGQLDVLLCTFGAASTGINLTSSNLMVINDLPWEVSSLEQAKKRSHRLGQNRACRIVYVLGSKVDELILNTLKAKSKVISKVITSN